MPVLLDNSAPGRHASEVNLLHPPNAKPFDSSGASSTSPTAIPMACQQDLEAESPSVPLTEANVFAASSSASNGSPTGADSALLEEAVDRPSPCLERRAVSPVPERPPYITPGKLTIRAQRSDSPHSSVVAKGEHAYSICNETHAQTVLDALDRKISVVKKKTALYTTLYQSTRNQYGRMLRNLKQLNTLRRLRGLPRIVFSTSQATKENRKSVFSVATE